MTRLINDAQLFATESLNGFAAVHTETVALVADAGVIRATTSPGVKVALVMGGGAGHYPAFLGWVGGGLAHGAVSGNIFSSPSAGQVARVARAAATGGKDVLFLPINYAGDILHFTEAANRLRADGIAVGMVAVTDDIASGSSEARDQRRGIAGSFIVAKIVGAAVDAGADLATAARIGRTANDATRTLGLAFTGCTLPGSARANFHVPAGKMALGLGIHGEPGLRMLDLGSADDAADVLIDGLFDERFPEAGRRVAVLVNGLGSTTYDELNVIFARVAQRITDADMTVVAPAVGELVTSLDMAGVSVSLTYLDAETEALWTAPAHSPAFTRGPCGADPAHMASSSAAPGEAIAHSAPDHASNAANVRTSVLQTFDAPTSAPASEASRALGACIAEGFAVIADELAVRAGQLGRLDGVAGDGDHGACMERGSRAARHAAAGAADAGAGAGGVLIAAGDGWSDVGGGTSGALWGAGLRAAGVALGADVGGGAATVRDGVAAFVSTIVDRGGASIGDKTMVDAMIPFARCLTDLIDEGSTIDAAWHAASEAARAAALGTAAFAARRGRSRTHGDASLGTPDPGCVSFAMVVGHLDTTSPDGASTSTDNWDL